jgi:hypothetical protein
MTQKGIFGVFGPWGPKMAILAILAVRAIWGPKLLVLDGPPALGGHIWPLGPICQYGLWGPGLRGSYLGSLQINTWFCCDLASGAHIWPPGGALPGCPKGVPKWTPEWPVSRTFRHWTPARGSKYGSKMTPKGVPNGSKLTMFWPILGPILGPPLARDLLE